MLKQGKKIAVAVGLSCQSERKLDPKKSFPFTCSYNDIEDLGHVADEYGNAWVV